jgi:putative dimethyl sulfoxide reductase chaperone
MAAHRSTAQLSATQAALARRHAYTLFGRLFLDGLTAELRPYVEQVPQLAAAVRAVEAAQAAQAAHQQLFGFQLFPYESLFLDDSGLLGGAVTEAVQRCYAEAGFSTGPAAAAADHVGYELSFLALLSQTEADGTGAVQAGARRRQRPFLENHLLRWLPPLVVALQQQPEPFYAVLAGLTWAVAADHYAALSPATTLSFTLPPLPDLLARPETGLKQIARYLVTPPHSGLFLGREDVRALARPLKLPTGFGGRQEMLHQLLQAAARYDSLPALLDGLAAVLAAWHQAYRRLIAADPPLAPFIAPWQQRLDQTALLLQRIDSFQQRPF